MNRDENYLTLCQDLSLNSKCLSRQIGCIIVKDKSIISTGYNGPPRGVSHCSERYLNDDKLINELKTTVNYNEVRDFELLKSQCPRRVLGYKSGEGLDWCIAGHAERNCIVNAARDGISVKGSTMFCGCAVPCSPCLVEIINAGIIEIVVTKLSFYDNMAEWIIKEADLYVRTFNCD